jgi:orotidine-5'-phosphate decarboxylase
MSERHAERLIVALDTTDPVRAEMWARAVESHCGLFKLGSEFFLANGPLGVRAIVGRPIFLDLKFHDIPNTVGRSVLAVLPLKPQMLTLHASGGAEMIAAARQAAESVGTDRPLLLAVTVLTSLDAESLAATGVDDIPSCQSLRLAKLALSAGADGLVCSPLEVTMLRDAFGDGVKLVVPGIRPTGAPPDDQARTMTPQEAIAAGADWIVVGRPITSSLNPSISASAIVAAIAQAIP